MARPKTGQLIWRSKGWSARYWKLKDGEEIRVCEPLGTENKQAARAKMIRLLTSDADPEPTGPIESFKTSSKRIVDIQRQEGLVSWKDRLQRLENYCYPEFGQKLVTRVTASDIKNGVLRGLAEGKAKMTLRQIKIDCSTIFKTLLEEGLVKGNPARDVSIPANAKQDTRPRCILTDEEIGIFMASPEIKDLELKTLAASSRIIGGQRTSDLHDWDWADIDTRDWLYAWVSRPKTDTKDKHEIPESIIPVLKAWWLKHGRPRKGPVFPVRRGKTVGKKKSKNITYARKLRDALWAAGIVRPLPGYEEATTDKERRALCLLQVGSRNERPVDFHSFRRAYSTALAEANVPLQKAMRLAGHRSPATHMKYIDRVKTLSAPPEAVALKTQKAPSVPL
jgi:integrase